MINEMAEAKQYIQQWECKKAADDESVRFKKRYFISPGRVLRILARYYWFQDETTKNIEDKKEKIAKVKEKITKIKEKLNDFYKDVIIGAYDENSPEFLKYKKSLERYNKDYLEQDSHNFTFYSIIADAVNAGSLKEITKIELTAAEILHVMKSTGYATARTRPNEISPILALALICYYKVFAESKEKLLKDGYIPIVTASVNAWLGNEAAWQEVKTWKKDENKKKYSFISIVNVGGSVRFKVNENVIKNSEVNDIEVKECDKVREFEDVGFSLKNGLLSAIKNFKKYFKNT